MNKESIVKIISCNTDGAKICAAAARISTTKGTALTILESDRPAQKDDELIQKVLSSGHKSVIEHAVFTIAFNNVSAFVEQFLIEFRLASFTVKSRRYVDFGAMGYYIPALPDRAGEEYCAHMDYLFGEYNYLIAEGMPKEDARFVLPYCFYSNFYCTMNGRELTHVLRSIYWGRGAVYDELRAIADQLKSQLAQVFPSILGEIERPSQGEDIAFGNGTGTKFAENNVQLVSFPHNELGVLKMACDVAGGAWGYFGSDEEMIRYVLAKERKRELEQLHYSFLLSGVSLSGITHIARHRMQSVVIPPVATVDTGRFVVPDTVKKDGALLKRYLSAFQRTKEIMAELFGRADWDGQYRVYFAMGGHELTVATTMNARELLLFFSLRTCNRAQWEIREIAAAMLRLLRERQPLLFEKMGPGCFVRGTCPEGRLSCGRMAAVKKEFEERR
ncbi:MAG TPA: FAD-dependent thymidylate synthase [Clostridiales bacterium]|nr:FAD-dependent thymidylate synthase [Clostridiales bacterium]